MPSASKRIHFGLVVALLLGWGAMGIMLVQAGQSLIQSDLDQPAAFVQPRGVKLGLDVDKRIYRAGDPILISVRNDSRKDVFLAEQADGCAAGWWVVEALENGETWRLVQRTKASCADIRFGLVAFPRHSIESSEWNGMVPGSAIGDVAVAAPTGTYRIRVPYVYGEVTEADWALLGRAVVSSEFTIQ